MSILDLLLSLPGAPDGGVGLGPGLGGGAPAAGGSSPPACMGGAAGGADGDGDGDGDDDDDGHDDDAYEQRREGRGFLTGDTEDLVTKRFLNDYGKWINRGNTAERIGKAFTGLVVIPLTAPVLCLETSLRSPGLGSSR